jgi:hypothetical protein
MAARCLQKEKVIPVRVRRVLFAITDRAKKAAFIALRQ